MNDILIKDSEPHSSPFKLDMSMFELDVDLDDYFKRKSEIIDKLESEQVQKCHDLS